METTCADSFELFYGLFRYNPHSHTQLRKLRDSFAEVERQVGTRMRVSVGGGVPVIFREGEDTILLLASFIRPLSIEYFQVGGRVGVCCGEVRGSLTNVKALFRLR